MVENRRISLRIKISTVTFCKSCDKFEFRKNGPVIQIITTLKSEIVINHGDIQADFQPFVKSLTIQSYSLLLYLC